MHGRAPEPARSALSLGLLSCVLMAGAVLVPIPATAASTDASERPKVGAEVLAGSVTTYDPAGSVTTYSVEGSVRTVETERQDAGQTVVSLDSDILFAFGSAALPAPATARIGQLVADLPQGVAVAVTGHTDSIGQPAVNLRLSQARAQAVAAAVTAARRDLRLTVAGRGDTQPVAPNTSGGKDDPAGRALNRRVELRYAA